jgi:hypothetical protein
MPKTKARLNRSVIEAHIVTVDNLGSKRRLDTVSLVKIANVKDGGSYYMVTSNPRGGSNRRTAAFDAKDMSQLEAVAKAMNIFYPAEETDGAESAEAQVDGEGGGGREGAQGETGELRDGSV